MFGRDYRIRTYDILLPKQALYQAELSPEWQNTINNKKNILQLFFYCFL